MNGPAHLGGLVVVHAVPQRGHHLCGRLAGGADQEDECELGLVLSVQQCQLPERLLVRAVGAPLLLALPAAVRGELLLQRLRVACSTSARSAA